MPERSLSSNGSFADFIGDEGKYEEHDSGTEQIGQLHLSRAQQVLDRFHVDSRNSDSKRNETRQQHPPVAINESNVEEGEQLSPQEEQGRADGEENE